MAKKLAVDERFQTLIDNLRQRGYDVVSLYGPQTGVKACIYHDGIKDLHSAAFSQNTAVLMINGRDKTADDIEIILQRGVYSPLF